MSSIGDVNIQDHELQRQELLSEMIAECGENWIEQYAPGTHGCHELLDRTSLAAATVEQHILSHPACAQNREWYELAIQAVEALNDLYQRIGAEHLSANGKDIGKAHS